jgi:hypothetical protein
MPAVLSANNQSETDSVDLTPKAIFARAFGVASLNVEEAATHSRSPYAASSLPLSPLEIRSGSKPSPHESPINVSKQHGLLEGRIGSKQSWDGLPEDRSGSKQSSRDGLQNLSSQQWHFEDRSPSKQSTLESPMKASGRIGSKQSSLNSPSNLSNQQGALPWWLEARKLDVPDFLTRDVETAASSWSGRERWSIRMDLMRRLDEAPTVQERRKVRELISKLDGADPHPVMGA